MKQGELFCIDWYREVPKFLAISVYNSCYGSSMLKNLLRATYFRYGINWFIRSAKNSPMERLQLEKQYKHWQLWSKPDLIYQEEMLKEQSFHEIIF